MRVSYVVVSAGRAGAVVTPASLPPAIRSQVLLAVPQDEAAAYEPDVRTHGLAGVLPVPVRGIHHTRQWLTEWCPTEVLAQMSDDMVFARRTYRSPGDWSLRPATPFDVGEALEAMATAVTTHRYAHVGISYRSGNNRLPPRWAENTRLNDCYFHDVEVLRRNGIRWDRLPVMEDFDVTLQLLRLGYENRVFTDVCWGQHKGSNAPGGCSGYRTGEVQEAGARGLAALHPGLVRLRTKRSPSWGGGLNERADVTVLWKAALALASVQVEAAPTPQQEELF